MRENANYEMKDRSTLQMNVTIELTDAVWVPGGPSSDLHHYNNLVAAALTRRPLPMLRLQVQRARTAYTSA